MSLSNGPDLVDPELAVFGVGRSQLEGLSGGELKLKGERILVAGQDDLNDRCS